MISTPVPYEILGQLQEALSLGEADLACLRRVQPIFASRKEEFAQLFHGKFLGLPETQMILEHEHRPRFLLHAWANWFERLFSGAVDSDFLAYLWRIGTRHVEVNLNQRFSNLGFSLVRQFCHEVVVGEIPAEERTGVVEAINKVLDFCVLVETTAYIDATTSCDLEVIRGVADRVRTPATVIGGNLKRLLRKGDGADPNAEIYDVLILENQRLERMVRDIETYSTIFERKPEFVTHATQTVLDAALGRLDLKNKLRPEEISLSIATEAARFKADALDIEQALVSLLQNAVDAADPAGPVVRVSAVQRLTVVPEVEIEVCNNGDSPRQEDLDRLFSPFYSTKPLGTGFGLSIARLAVRKNFGKLSIEPMPGEGARAVITLSAP